MIYVHVPFCRSFCTYCDFYSEICSGKASQQVQNRVFDDYVEGVVEEIHDRVAVAAGVGVPDDVRSADPSHCKQWAPPSYVAEGGTITGTPTPAAATALQTRQCSTEPFPHTADGGTITGTPTPAATPHTLQCNAEPFPHTAEGGTITGTPTPAAATALVTAPAPDAAAPETLYFGGGTPSVLPLAAIAKIVEALGPRPYEEFTVEVNPDDITEKGVEYIRGLVRLGVNRISMGVQSFDDSILCWMNRRHNAQGARDAMSIIREGGIRNLSIDLIFGLAQLSDNQWQQTIDEALGLKPEHISAYQLSIEEGSALAKLVREGKYTEASDEQCRRQYDILCERLAEAGFVHYEISNWALPGHEAMHNSAYWRRVPYIGLGPGAHSLGFAGDGEHVPTVRSWNSEKLAQRMPDGHLERWTSESERLSAAEIAEETVMLALRTAAGIDEKVLRQIAGSAKVDAMLADGSLVPSEAERSEQWQTAGADAIGAAQAAGRTAMSETERSDRKQAAGSETYASQAAGSTALSEPKRNEHWQTAGADAIGAAQAAGSERFLRIPESRFFVSDDIISDLLA